MAVLDGVAATWAPDTAALVGYLAVPWDYTESTAHELEISLQPNSCYTFVAAGLPPVSEVNIRIMQSTFILAQDQDIGAQAVLGKKPYCYKNAFAYPVKVRAVLEVAQGCGVAAAALYVAP